MIRRRLRAASCTGLTVALVACGTTSGSDDANRNMPEVTSGTISSGSRGAAGGAGGGGSGSSNDTGTGAGGSTSSSAGSGGAGGADDPLTSLVVVTFNSGTTEGLDHNSDTADGYTDEQAQISDQYYGDGLAWQLAIDHIKTFFATVQPDIVAFQEIFHGDDCDDVPSQYHAGFVCASWSDGDQTVAQTVVGMGYQVACNLGKPDKCVAVRQNLGTFTGCNSNLCLDGLDGESVNDCGSGSRVGRGTIELADGKTLVVVHVHGTSGRSGDDKDCRVEQVEQVFLDLDGEPAANGSYNIVLGDLNTDPGRAALLDSSARRWNDFVGGNKPFKFLTDVGFSAAPTYAGLANVDHIISDSFAGNCWVPGVTPGVADAYPYVYFDHKPIVCELALP